MAARWLLGQRGGGLILDTIVGMCGAVCGGYIFAQVTGESLTGFDLTSLVVAFFGALVLLLVIGSLRRGPGEA